MSQDAWKSVIELAVWLLSIEGGLLVWYWKYTNTEIAKAKEKSVGEEALKKLLEKVDDNAEKQRKDIRDIHDEIRRNWATFYEIQSKK